MDKPKQITLTEFSNRLDYIIKRAETQLKLCEKYFAGEVIAHIAAKATNSNEWWHLKDDIGIRIFCSMPKQLPDFNSWTHFQLKELKRQQANAPIASISNNVPGTHQGAYDLGIEGLPPMRVQIRVMDDQEYVRTEREFINPADIPGDGN